MVGGEKATVVEAEVTEKWGEELPRTDPSELLTSREAALMSRLCAAWLTETWWKQGGGVCCTRGRSLLHKGQHLAFSRFFKTFCSSLASRWWETA